MEALQVQLVLMLQLFGKKKAAVVAVIFVWHCASCRCGLWWHHASIPSTHRNDQKVKRIKGAPGVFVHKQLLMHWQPAFKHGLECYVLDSRSTASPALYKQQIWTL